MHADTGGTLVVYYVIVCASIGLSGLG